MKRSGYREDNTTFGVSTFDQYEGKWKIIASIGSIMERFTPKRINMLSWALCAVAIATEENLKLKQLIADL
jgi:hypothetical protein